MLVDLYIETDNDCKYFQNGYGDMNDIFRVFIPGVSERVRLNNVRSVFRLVHHSTGCAVQSDNKKLPKW